MKIQKINVFLNLGNSKDRIGEMILEKGLIYFKYDVEFLIKGIEISPFKMKLTPDIITPKELHLDGLFGVFSDSIPDGWGKLLLDRKLQSLGVSLNEISSLDRLSYLDSNSMGAISYEPENEIQTTNIKVDLDLISNEVEVILKGNSQDVIDELFQLGGSSGGARPKILVGYNSLTDEIISGQSIFPDGFEHWIIKFPSTYDLYDSGLIEFTYNQMAQNSGIEVADFKIFKTKSGKFLFGSKRFDRITNEKLHLHSVAGLLHDNFRMSTIDYGHIMDCAFILEKDFNAYEKIYRLAVFNILAHNRDDHSKNFSFLMNKDGNWKFSPAYDLTFSQSSYGFHSTSVAGESKNPTVNNLMILAADFGIKNANKIIDEVKNSISNFKNLASNYQISKDSCNLIEKSLQL
ncbi:type II toxin-antitoxin system HipA family toxin [Flavobacterium sp.]|uniref:type II toxin-antitoxin system HipA family toxin n=1 Tax=Flavobacterium sp. TaxID=239 RepID=UPI003750CFF8